MFRFRQRLAGGSGCVVCEYTNDEASYGVGLGNALLVNAVDEHKAQSAARKKKLKALRASPQSPRKRRKK